ncbi:hypothetical protein [Actinoplanes solisilvae]|uniref:hypothetical protein n=1 Tax=Actinoplanes solisilvae TaxID=2486853 RepID=UPI001F0BD99C|nr:hypothetical protein [Actinoplanes solisilvae]
MNASQEPAPPHQPGDPATTHGGYGSPEGGTVGYGTPEAGFGLAHPSGPAASPSGFAQAWNVRASSPRPWKRTVIVAVGVFLAVLALGAPLGVLWHFLAPAVPVINAGQQGVVVNDPSPEEYIAADGWFALLGLGFGLLVAIGAWLLLRRDRGPFLLLGVVLGTLGAGWLVAPWIGEKIGRGGYQRWVETAQQGATYLAPPEVHSLGPTLVPAFAAAIVLTLLAGWSNDPDLDRSGAHPGYGPNNDYPDEQPSYLPPGEPRV